LTSADRKRAAELLGAGMSPAGVAALLSLPLAACEALAAPSAPRATTGGAGRCAWCDGRLVGRATEHPICAVARLSPRVWPLALLEAVELVDPGDRAVELYNRRLGAREAA
jgi:hypothetical protein